MRVVIVAADQTLMRSLTMLLDRRGHDVACFADADAALQLIRTDDSVNAIIVVDGANATPGPEICWEARLLASVERPLYICLISLPLASAAFIEALDCGADDVLQLPLASDELYARLRAAERFAQMQRKLIEMATRDGLTGLLNRPAFFERAARIGAESGQGLAAIMVDIDHFKSINDRHGHAIGDEALRAVASCLRGCTDDAGRLGGEEFALLFGHGDIEAAGRAAESLRRQIAALEIGDGDISFPISCSFGVAAGAPGDDIDLILRKADDALYRAKRSGRNAVAVDRGETLPPRPQPGGILCGDDAAALRQPQ
jgi:two-component system, cell cycle response regulator